MLSWIYLISAIFFEVIATTSLKISSNLNHHNIFYILLCIVCYSISFILLSFTLKTMHVGIAYAIWSGLGIVFIMIISYFLFNQTVDIYAIIGTFLIILGIIIINLFSKVIH